MYFIWTRDGVPFGEIAIGVCMLRLSSGIYSRKPMASLHHLTTVPLEINIFVHCKTGRECSRIDNIIICLFKSMPPYKCVIHTVASHQHRSIVPISNSYLLLRALLCARVWEQRYSCATSAYVTLCEGVGTTLLLHYVNIRYFVRGCGNNVTPALRQRSLLCARVWEQRYSCATSTYVTLCEGVGTTLLLRYVNVRYFVRGCGNNVTPALRQRTLLYFVRGCGNNVTPALRQRSLLCARVWEQRYSCATSTYVTLCEGVGTTLLLRYVNVRYFVRGCGNNVTPALRQRTLLCARVWEQRYSCATSTYVTLCEGNNVGTTLLLRYVNVRYFVRGCGNNVTPALRQRTLLCARVWEQRYSCATSTYVTLCEGVGTTLLLRYVNVR